jgi:hypothetical protein
LRETKFVLLALPAQVQNICDHDGTIIIRPTNMTEVPEINEKSEGLLRTAAAAFWEGCFQSSFPRHETQSRLPPVAPSHSSLPIKAVAPSTKAVLARFPLKNANAAAPAPKMSSVRKSVSADEGECRPLTCAVLAEEASDIKRSFSTDAYENVRHRRAQRSIHLQRRLPALPDSGIALDGNRVTELRAVEAMVRADLIHGRREGTVEEFDEMTGTILGKPCNNSGSGKSGELARDNQASSRRGSASSGSEPSTSRRSSFDGVPDAATLDQMIATNSALKDAIAANLQLPSFARNTISSLIQRVHAQDQCAALEVTEKAKTAYKRNA